MRWLLLLSLWVGCAASEPAPVSARQASAPPAAPRSDGPGSLAHLYDADGRPIAMAGQDVPSDARPKSYEPQRVGHQPEPTAPHTRRVGLHNVNLRGARLDTALQTLAKLSGYGVVIEDAMPTPIDLQLNAVEPFDALMALAEAHDVDVSRRGNLLVIRPAASRPAAAPSP